MRRKGNGPGIGGPAKGAGMGDGWGGPANGASTSRIKPGDPDGIAALAHDPDVKAAREARIAALKDRLFALATGAQREETQLAAAVAYLNREEGLPVARQISATVDDPEKVLRIEIIDATSDPDTAG